MGAEGRCKRDMTERKRIDSAEEEMWFPGDKATEESTGCPCIVWADVLDGCMSSLLMPFSFAMGFLSNAMCHSLLQTLHHTVHT